MQCARATQRNARVQRVQILEFGILDLNLFENCSIHNGQVRAVRACPAGRYACKRKRTNMQRTRARYERAPPADLRRSDEVV
jgi:hypothetical protein